MRNKSITADQAAQFVPDGATLGTIGGGGGLVEANTLLAGREDRGVYPARRSYGTADAEALFKSVKKGLPHG